MLARAKPTTITPAVIVIVESCTICRQLLAMTIEEQFGHTVAAACASIADATAIVLQTGPDLVISEWALRDGSGLDLVRAVRARRPATRWLLLPAVLKFHVVREAECLGVQGMVLKHAGVATLREAIATVLAGGTYYCAQSSGMMKTVYGSRPASATARLTARELEVLRWIAEGKRNAEIAQILAITPATVKCHVEHLLEKLGVETRCAAAAKWLNG